MTPPDDDAQRRTGTLRRREVEQRVLGREAMHETIDHQPSYALLTLDLGAGEALKAEPGAMVAMSGVEIETKAQGGILKGFKRAVVGGESFFQNTYTAGGSGGWLQLAPSAPGDINWIDIQPGQRFFIQSGSYMASTMNVGFDTKFQGFKGMFSGEKLFFLAATSNDGQPGRVYFNSYGAIHELKVTPGSVVTVDTGHMVAWQEGVDYSIRKVGGWKSTLFSGEGLVCDFSGSGTVFVQTRNMKSLVGIIASMLPPSRGN